jgi:hypothetical protein
VGHKLVELLLVEYGDPLAVVPAAVATFATGLLWAVTEVANLVLAIVFGQLPSPAPLGRVPGGDRVLPPYAKGIDH